MKNKSENKIKKHKSKVIYSKVYNNNGLFMVDSTYISSIKLTPEEEQKLIDAGLLATMKDMNIIKNNKNEKDNRKR